MIRDASRLIITRSDLDDVAGDAYCAPGARRWFDRMRLSWRDFVFNGIDADVLEQTGDAMAMRLVAHVRERDGR